MNARSWVVVALRVPGSIDPRMEDIAERKRKGEKERDDEREGTDIIAKR